MKMVPPAILLQLLVLGLLTNSVWGANTYSNEVFGITLIKPENWVFHKVTKMPAVTGKLTREEFDKLVKDHSTTPLLQITKHQEPFDDLNPGLTILLLPLEDASIERGKSLLEAIANGARNKHEDFKLIAPIKETSLKGHSAVHVEIQYTFEGPHGKPVPEGSEIWVLPRGNHFLLLGISVRQDEETGRREEFQPIIDSLKFSPISDVVPNGGRESASKPGNLFLNESKQVPARMEWNREIVSKKEGQIRFVVSSPKPFAVTLVTDKAYKDMRKGVKRKLGKEDVLLSIDCKEPSFEKTLSLKPGSYHFIIENQSDKEVPIKLQCFELK